ncbi:hypothetical protein EKE94_09255 [Mesobaculum littorinae]|uniref:Uncharacterized protein n=1 Tax=Mesobaculum littorinae TaxID=2486419 RepID=A0A438AGE5_9RHOB|nr:hypothetical protein [Mesobaculum littorinae]RVV97685.1 hypothetical protein EKE94_09255 [Mesobaculum littorinae]
MPKLITQATRRPTRKVTAAGAGGLVTALCVTIVEHYVPGAGDIIGPEIAAVLTAAGAAIAG